MRNMNPLQKKAVDIIGRPWDEIAAETKRLKLEYERLLNSSSSKERERAIGFRDDIRKGVFRFCYTNNSNAQGGRSNGGGRGWYASDPIAIGCVRTDLVLAD